MIPSWFPKSQVPSLQAYEDFTKIDEGGFGEIYTASLIQDKVTIPVIIKRLSPIFSSDPAKRKMLEHEAKVLKTLKHPQIPKYYEGFLSEEECFFIMERVFGVEPGSLFLNARSSGVAFPFEMGFYIIQSSCEILQNIHQMGWVHNDIKLQNFLITQELKVYLIDFSMADPIGSTPEELRGTIKFMPPERFAKKELSPQVDLFPLSLLLYFLRTETMVLQGKTVSELFGRWLRQEQRATIQEQKFPKPLEEFFIKNLSTKPELRVQSAMELNEEMKALANALQLNLNKDHLKSIYQKLVKIS